MWLEGWDLGLWAWDLIKLNFLGFRALGIPGLRVKSCDVTEAQGASE